MVFEYNAIPVPDFSRWKRESSTTPSRHWAKVSAYAEGANSLKLLLAPYAPYFPTAQGVTISAFYVASNMLHALAGDDNLNLPIKPLLAGYGIGAYGRNGLISIPGFGTRFAAAVVKSQEMPDAKWHWCDDRPLADECAKCTRCVSACPTGALLGNGRLDVEKCLRAQAQYQTPPMPEISRALIGAAAWGCEECQTVCPRNAKLAAEKMPPALEQALELKRLLYGDVKPLGIWIGSNYARPARMQARACLVAANLRRRDLIDDIKKLKASPVEAVRECALWALDRLNYGGS